MDEQREVEELRKKVQDLQDQLSSLESKLEREKERVKKQKLKRKKREQKLLAQMEVGKKRVEDLEDEVRKSGGVSTELGTSITNGRQHGDSSSNYNASEEDAKDDEKSSPPSTSSLPTSPLSLSPITSRKSRSPRILQTKSSSFSEPMSLNLNSNDDLEESLRECARIGNDEKLAKLLTVGVDMNSKDESGYTALHWAAINGRSQCMRVLIKAGADLNQVDHGGWTPLHYCAYKNHLDCVTALLIQPNIDVEIKNVLKKTATNLTTSRTIQSLIKEVKNPASRKLIDAATKFWSQESNESVTAENLPEAIKEKEQQLFAKEKALLEREQEIKRAQGEVQLIDETLKKKQREETERKEDLKKKEEQFAVIENQIKKRMEETGESELGNTIFTIKPEDMTFMEEIGHGSYGSVYKAKWRGDLVAAKRLKCKLEDVELIQSFQKETLLLSKMRHPNIVMIMAASCRVPELIIVTELMKSDLGVLLASKEKIEWKEKIQMAVDIARGMTYLHNMNPVMVHRDLKPGNLLVDEFRRVKISDFGTAIMKEKLGTELIGTAAYMSPERLREESSDEKTDIYSYGVVLWELLTRKVAWEGLSNIQIVARVGYANELLPLSEPKGTPPGFVSLIKECWETYNIKRPSFDQILKTLKTMRDNL